MKYRAFGNDNEKPSPAYFMSDTVGEMRFTDSRLAAENQVPVSFDETTGRAIPDPLCRQRLSVESKIKRLEGKPRIQRAQLNPAGKEVRLPACDLILHQQT